jgi:[histone H3]-lysine79 N-trimethyltransferase
MRHGADMVSGSHSKNFLPAYRDLESAPEIELRYPSASKPERFKLVKPRENDGYNPFEDIYSTVQQVCEHYFPKEKSMELLDENGGLVRRLRKAIVQNSYTSFHAVIKEYNTLISKSLADGTIASALKNTHTLPFPVVERILAQATSRTSSLRVHELRAYENGTDNVYGELLPRFIHNIFRETNLDSSSVFVDLGSGIGNVVLQAALETGAESWGIEVMDNPADVGKEQRREYLARAKLWGVKTGSTKLLHDSFIGNKEIDAAIARADVILINNKAFTEDTNAALLLKFLDVKEGARIVSLKSFVPDDWKIAERNMEDPKNLLKVKRMEYFSDCVSWTDGGGDYFIATKDSSMLRDFEKNWSSRGRR